MQPSTRLRVSVVGLFVDGGDVLLLHQTTPPEPDCWDLPGGGILPDEPLLVALEREVREETGIESFEVDGLVTVVEGFYAWKPEEVLHSLNIVYRCSVLSRPAELKSQDAEVGDRGIQWLPIASLHQMDCSTRCWEALNAAGYLTHGDHHDAVSRNTM
ncbi:NUDIX domain-containing protein [Leptolyngbya sp. AN02str]|uniref:NUDIX domain-containing protein n=1 Tax=Leptolyngbya sp. AN02str TaxID=3423363 RepID=UPI003D31C61D